MDPDPGTGTGEFGVWLDREREGGGGAFPQSSEPNPRGSGNSSRDSRCSRHGLIRSARALLFDFPPALNRSHPLITESPNGKRSHSVRNISARPNSHIRRNDFLSILDLPPEVFVLVFIGWIKFNRKEPGFLAKGWPLYNCLEELRTRSMLPC